jgi:uncharacterized protein
LTETPEKASRITLVDALRGLALAGIAIVHFGEQYLGYMPPPDHRSYNVHGTFDGVLEALAWLFIRGKGFGLFSLLFGLSFALQMQRAERRDPAGDFRWRFAWRLGILFAIGFLHGLVYSGDILTVYALLGVPLLLFYRVGDRWLLALALVLAIGTPRLVQRAVQGPARPGQSTALQAQMDESATRHWKALTDGDVAAIARIHATEGFRSKWEFQFGPMGRGWQTFALFLVGLWVGRRRAFEQVEQWRAWWKRLFRWTGWLTLAIPLLAIALFVAGQALGGGSRGGAQPAGASAGAMPDMAAWPLLIGLCVYDTWNVVMTLFLVSAFVLLFQRPRWRQRLSAFAPVGRMALSSYVSQTILGSIVFFGFGLGLLGRFGDSVTLPIGAAVFAVQVLACSWWLSRFRFGPIEWLWRSLTWLRVEPFRLAPRELRRAA